MTLHLAFLRGVNLGGHKQVSMADLRAMLDTLGMEDPRSLLNSGNLVFRGSQSSAQLERLLETETKKRLGLTTEYFLRTAAEWRAIIAANPKAADAKRDPGRFLLMLLKDAPAPKDVQALKDAVTGRERVSVKGREAYIVFPDGVGKSRLTTALIDAKLRTRCTGRNWNTTLKIDALAASVQ
jgi:uncharacterized protein (DUF1697 family)